MSTTYYLEFYSMCKKYGYKPDDDVKEYLSENFETIIDINKENFANAREVRNLFEKILVAQADRLLTYPEQSDEELNRITIEDVKNAE